MTTIPSGASIGSQNRVQAEFKPGLDDVGREILTRQKEWFTAKLTYDHEAQLAHQNAEPIHTAFRLNGKLAGTIGVNGGFTSTGIADGGAFQRATAFAKQAGLSGETATNYISKQVSQALIGLYGEDMKVEVFEPQNRPTTGEMHREMFGPSTSQYEGISSNMMAYIKHFAQTYNRVFGEDPFAGIDISHED